MSNKLTVKDLKSAYQRGENIMALFRDAEKQSDNSPHAIETSYELQAGSYIDLLQNKVIRDHKKRHGSMLAEVLDGLDGNSILEAGVGEATTLVPTVSAMHRPMQEIYGFDLCWSRVDHAINFAAGANLPASFFVGDLTSIPVAENAVDIVYTYHAVEPNRGREKEILEELNRIARRYVVLVEPSNVLGSERTKARIDEHRYCRDLARHADELGLPVVEHRLFDPDTVNDNQPALLVLEATGNEQGDVKRDHIFACPDCKSPLHQARGHYFCAQDQLIYPVIDGIPCLRAEKGVLGNSFLASPQIGQKPGQKPGQKISQQVGINPPDQTKPKKFGGF